MLILGIETSCDETSAALVAANRGRFQIISNIVSSQVKVHARYGGVVPEVAARLHIEKILPVVELALEEARRARLARRARQAILGEVGCIAVCAGPGLMSSLLVGVETAKTLAYVFNKPLIRVNHIEGHLLSGRAIIKKNIKFPAIGLIVSGGHTQLILVKDYLQYELIGETLDDAAGEAFDKVAKLLDLGYPGGPAISAVAEKMQTAKYKPQNKFVLPRPMIDSGDLRMSFSGLKTAVLYTWEKTSVKNNRSKAELAAEFQRAVVDVLTEKTMRAAARFGARSIILGGGVSANSELRKSFSAAAALRKIELFLPELSMTGDNAAMIAIAGYYHARKKEFVSPFKMKADADWELVS